MNKDWVKCLLLISSGILFAFIYRVNGAISIVGYFLVPVIYLLFKNSKKLGTAKCFSKMGGANSTDLCFALFYDTKYTKYS